MTIIEKYEYISNFDLKIVRKEDLRTLSLDELKSIFAVDIKLYKELIDLVTQCTNEWETSELLTSLEGFITLKVSAHFDRNKFTSTVNKQLEGLWRFTN